MKLTKKDAYFENLHFTAQAVAKHDVRDYLNVLHVRTLNGDSYAIGTDGYRMRWARCDLDLGTYAVKKATKTILILDLNGESTFNDGDDLATRAMLLDGSMKFNCSDLIVTILRLGLPENPDYIDVAYFTNGILHAIVMPRKVLA